jgi:hypothetical protein
MSTMEMDPNFTAALRHVLVSTAMETPRVRRRWRWRVGTGVFVGVTLIVGGVALASGVFYAPGGPVNAALGNVVTATRTGTAIVELGARPATATDVSLTLTCLTVGTFKFPDGSSMSCDRSDMTNPSLLRTSSEVAPLASGVDSVTITTNSNSSWTLQATYVNQVTTSWGINASGETYGVADQSGTPDLIAVVIDDGNTHGYVKESALDCAAGGDVSSPAEAIAWDKVSQNRSISVPVYESDGTTVIGTFIVGNALHTVPLSTLSLGC